MEERFPLDARVVGNFHFVESRPTTQTPVGVARTLPGDDSGFRSSTGPSPAPAVTIPHLRRAVVETAINLTVARKKTSDGKNVLGLASFRMRCRLGDGRCRSSGLFTRLPQIHGKAATVLKYIARKHRVPLRQ